MALAPNITVSLSYPGSLLESSFGDARVTSSNAVLNPGAPAGGTVYDVWCINMNVQIQLPGTYKAWVYSAYELTTLTANVPTLRTGVNLANLDNVNWLLNYYNGANPGISFGEVQSAIWQLLGFKYTIASYLGEQNVPDIDALVALALANDGYVPDAGEVIGIVLDPTSSTGLTHYQPLIIESRAAKIGNFVWDDLNVDGVQDAGEQGIAGATVELVRDMNGDGQFSGNEILATTVTDLSGYYSFKGLTPALEYQVRFTRPAGFDGNSPRQVDGSASSDSNSDGLLSSVIVLKPGEYNAGIDAGFFRHASLGDRVWLDANGNGRQDAGEAGIAGVTVHLRDAAGTVVATTTTDTLGAYSFSGLRPGTYDVQVVTPTGFTVTRQDVGDDATDSDLGTTGLTGRYTLTSGATVTSVDAGFFRTAGLGNRLWLDANGNGLQDTGEQGIAGQTITLIGGGIDRVVGTADDTTAAMTTDANGYYHFTGLAPGVQYQVVFGQPAGTVFTSRDSGSDVIDSDVGSTGRSPVVTLTSGQDNTSIDAGVYVPVSIGNRVWEDANGNGRQDAGEAGIAGATVQLLNANGVVVATTTTDADGNYNFANLKPGLYDVRFIAPTGYIDTRQATDSGGPVAGDGMSSGYLLASGERVTDANAGFFRSASLGDRVWLDADGSGRQDAGEQGLAGQTVTLIGGGADGVIGTGNDDTTTTVVTDADGRYSFTGLRPGTQVQVVFGKPEGAVFTGRDSGDDLGDSDADAAGRSAVITLTSGENNTSVDAGVYLPASIGDRVWEDVNGNGRQDAGEAGIAGVTVQLRDAMGAVVASTTTDAEGRYAFTGLRPSSYDLQFTTPTGFVVTRRHVGEGAGDSDADATGLTGRYTLSSGAVVTTVDAGFFRSASLGDRVWLDADGSGRQDAGEQGLAGQTVTLIGGGTDGVIGTADDTTASVTTDADGNYRFSGLTPGVQYQVVFGKPEGSVFTGRDSGDDLSDSDADAAGRSAVITLTSGENNSSVDAGVYLPASIGDRVWEDANGNGRQDAGEAGIGGVTVQLRDTDGAVVASTTTDAEGRYAFTGLQPGQYDLQFATPTGFVVTRRHVGEGAGDSDADASGLTGRYTLASGDAATTVDAGFYRTASLGDRLWIDANANGQQDAGEQGLAGQTVTLIGGGADGVLGTADDTTASVTTDADGNYRFTGLTPGVQYQVVFGKPAGYVFTAQDRGGDATDSDAAMATGRTQIVTLASGQADLSLDAGVYQSASLGQRVWLDLDGDGVQDTGEAGLAGVRVTLVSGTGAVLGSQLTDANGNYLFSSLTPGSYGVRFDPATLPLGYTSTTLPLNAGNGSAGAPTVLESGEADRSFNLGLNARVGIDVEKVVHGEYVLRTPGAGDEGLTPGFWKNHTGAGGAPLAGWPDTGLSPQASYEALFGVDVRGSAPTLLQALGANGGGVNALLRHSAAALLNAADPYVDYYYSREQIISMVRQAFATGDYETVKDLFAARNELGADRGTLEGGSTVKVVTLDMDADTAASGPTIPMGGEAVFTYVVRNTGTVALSGVSVTDSHTSGLQFVGGDTDRDGWLDVGETWTYTAREAVQTGGTTVGAGTATGRDAVSGRTASDTDLTHYTAGVSGGVEKSSGSASLDLEKLVHAEYRIATDDRGTEGLASGFWVDHSGSGVGWSETGLSPDASFEQLFGVDVPDAAPTLLQALSGEGGEVQALLRQAAAALLNASDPYISYLYTREQVVSMVQEAFAGGDYESARNLFTAQNELGADLDTLAGSTLVVSADVDADTADAALAVPAGGQAVYTYLLRNTGSVALDRVVVSDDRLAAPTLIGGDADGDGRLDVGETWVYTARETVQAGIELVSTGSASARNPASGAVLRDDDAAHVHGTAPVETSLALLGTLSSDATTHTLAW
ncbi:SdrD B-like domain-containing protein [Azohydromonas caseinilytica]|uniref:SD-repeat containing protein B domain-containing protein n=1 Tax=Azohydromonas caseinilytica TaxID=2728836 RepID=A0A848F9I3_9BURK|nr:SdrD B-like domain-containing protein [Azohydromonas caseinilytica]NML15385.1 hypothetical protein [Azohydromonas caseinilytica]